MHRMLVLYPPPADPAASRWYYEETHIPLAKKLPGLRKYEITQGPISTPAGPSGFHLIATLQFDSVAAIHEAFASPEGRATGADVKNFASGGADMLIFDSRDA